MSDTKDKKPKKKLLDKIPCQDEGVSSPTLFIAIGGVGVNSADYLKKTLAELERVKKDEITPIVIVDDSDCRNNGEDDV